ncbi:hypothetical protein MNBD_DELTA01-939 [hydrothermal vent metagenome]|uniref:TonB C-terminal domain-containing protein n=1 Tax=hydrothermal vent metagenome TaxID=652676 RepID=A0A3B0QQA2_9ZZZZ
MSIKTYQIGSNWIIFLAISIAMHLTLLVFSFSPEALKLITPDLHKKIAVQRQNPFYVEVITLPPGAAGMKITPKQLTRFANESRSVDVEGSPVPIVGQGRPGTQRPQQAQRLNLFPPRPSPTSQGSGSSRGLRGAGAKAGSNKTKHSKTGKNTGKNKGNQSKAEKGTGKGTKKSSLSSSKAVVKDGAIIIEELPAAASSGNKGNGLGNKGGSSGSAAAGSRTGNGNGAGEVGPPSLFPSNESIARVIRKNRGTGSRSQGGIYLRRLSKQLQINATELKDARYLLDLKRKLDLYWDYPASAARRGEQGTLRAVFKVKRDGTIYEIKLVKSSGYPTLDDAVINALRLCSPLNPLPDSFEKDELNVKARFKYILTQVQ